MANKNDCIDFEKLKELPISPSSFNIKARCAYDVQKSDPPDYPMRWAHTVLDSGIWIIVDQEGIHHEVTPMDAWELRKPLLLGDPEVVAFICILLARHHGFYVHPTVGLFNLSFLEQDLIQYDVTLSPGSTKPFPDKKELLKFCKPEFAYATQVIKRYYPDYTT